MFIDDVIKNPTKAELPESVEAQQALAEELPAAVTAQTIHPIFQYILRMHFDAQMFAVKAICADGGYRMNLMLRLPDYTQWVIANKEALLRR